MCSPIRWGIGSRSRRSGRSRFPATSVTRTRSATCFSPRPISTLTCSNRKCAASASRASRSTSSCPKTIERCFFQEPLQAASRGSATIPDVAELAALGATVIDLTDLKGTDPTNHDKFAQLAAVAPELRDVLARGVPADSPSKRCERNRCTWRRRGRLAAAHDPRRADQDHRQPVGVASARFEKTEPSCHRERKRSDPGECRTAMVALDSHASLAMTIGSKRGAR